MSTAARIWQWLAAYRRWVVLASMFTGLACALNLAVPLLVQGLIDHVIAAGQWGQLPLYAALLFLTFAGQALIGFSNAMVVGHVGQSVVHDLRHRVYAHLQRLSLSYFDRTPTGAIIGRLMDDVGAIQIFVTGQTFTLLTDLGTTVAISAVLITRDVRLAAVVLLIVPLYAANFRYFMREIRATNREVRSRMDVLFGHLKEKLDGIIVVKSYAREAAEEAAFRGELDEAHTWRLREARLRAAFGNISGAISAVGITAVFGVGAFEVLAGRLTPGEVVSTAAMAGMLFGPIARMADLAYVFEQAGASVERLGEVLDLEPEVAEPAQPRALPGGRAAGHVLFDRVGFGYQQGQPVVWDIRLDVKPGMRVALVGPTGCGKTTLVNLLMRFYDPTWGSIQLDGIPIDQLATADLRRQVGMVLQDPVIFHASVADNIRYGLPQAGRDLVERAARAALVHDFASALPDGYDTIVGEGGRPLSQGERQRLSIARALCLDPALVILDEATSSLDTASEALIQKALANLLAGRTALIIAHRLATIVDADLIVVMEGGLIVQKGRHDELLADHDGMYAQLCRRQFGEAQLEESRRIQAGIRAQGRVLDPGRSISMSGAARSSRHRGPWETRFV